MNIAYIRVSSQDQNPERQEVMMHERNVDKIFLEKLSGKNMDRPELKKMLNFVREGDSVIVESISRLGRSTKDVIDIVQQLNEKGVKFVSLKENIDTKTPNGRFLLNLFSSLSQLERETLLTRQREGIEVARNRGVYKGRRKIDNKNFLPLYKKWKNNEITASFAIKELGWSKATFYRRINERMSMDDEKNDKFHIIENSQRKKR